MKLLHKCVNWIAAMTFVAIMVMVLYQIVMRYFFRIGAPWVEEVTRLIYVYLSFIGGAICLRDKQLIVIETVPDLLPVPLRKTLAVFSEIFCFAVMVLLLRGAIKMAGITWGSPLATVSWISNGWIYIAGVASFSYMILIKLVALGSGIAKKRAPAEGGA